MNFIDREINLKLEKEFTSVKSPFESLIKDENLKNVNIICWIPHEVSSLVQIGWEDGLIEDLEKFLQDTIPKNKWKKHDEPGTPFRHNFQDHIKTVFIVNVNNLKEFIRVISYQS